MKGRRAAKITSYLIRFLILLLVFVINGAIIWRVFLSTSFPKEVKNLIPTEKLCQAYSVHGKDLILQYQDLPSITRAEKNYGYFSVEECVFIPEAEEVQILFRYNNSTLEHLQADYSLQTLPEKGSDLFDVTLVKTGGEGEERFFPAQSVIATSRLYTYVRFVFENVTVEACDEGVFADVYYVHDIDYEKEAYGTLCLYQNTDKWLPYRLSSAERKSLQ